MITLEEAVKIFNNHDFKGRRYSVIAWSELEDRWLFLSVRMPKKGDSPRNKQIGEYPDREEKIADGVMKTDGTLWHVKCWHITDSIVFPPLAVTNDDLLDAASDESYTYVDELEDIRKELSDFLKRPYLFFEERPNKVYKHTTRF